MLAVYVLGILQFQEELKVVHLENVFNWLFMNMLDVFLLCGLPFHEDIGCRDIYRLHKAIQFLGVLFRYIQSLLVIVVQKFT
jgi:hypothetical protein